MKLTHSFSDRYAEGKIGEQRIIDYFSDNWHVVNSNYRDQKRGIDFYFRHKANGSFYTVELKSDTKAAVSGNAFIETISVDATSTPKPGWAITCEADYIFYYIPPKELLLVLKPETIKQSLPTWGLQYRSVQIPNKDYHTHGIIVPLSRIKAIALKQINLPMNRPDFPDIQNATIKNLSMPL